MLHRHQRVISFLGQSQHGRLLYPTAIVVFYWSRAKPVKIGRISILGLGGIHLVDPVENSTPEVLDPLETDRLQKFRRLRAAATHLAVRDDVFVSWQLSVATRELSEGNQHGPRNTADLILVGLAHIEDEHVVACVKALLQ